MAYTGETFSKESKQCSNFEAFHTVISLIKTNLPFYVKYIYEGESNENLKCATKILNTARLSCKLTTMILMV
jgi:hypothetical protein